MIHDLRHHQIDRACRDSYDKSRLHRSTPVTAQTSPRDDCSRLRNGNTTRGSRGRSADRPTRKPWVTSVDRIINRPFLGLRHHSGIGRHRSTHLQDRRIGELGIHPVCPLRHPVFQVIHLSSPTTKTRQCPAVRGDCLPLRGVARLGFRNLRRQTIEATGQRGIGKLPRSQILPAVNPLLQEILIIKQTPPIIVIKKLSSIRGRIPANRIRRAVIGVASHRTVKIPNRTKGQLTIPRLGEISAQAQGIRIFGQDVENMKINRRFHIKPGPVAHRRIFIIRAIQGRLHVVDVALDVARLLGEKILLLGIDMSIPWLGRSVRRIKGMT